MGRPIKEFSARENGKSLQFFHNGEYCGSLPYALLCALARHEEGKRTVLENIQSSFKKDDRE